MDLSVATKSCCYQKVGIHCKKTFVDNFVKIKTGNRWIYIKFAAWKIENNER